MAITRTQIARQLYQFGGGADAGGKGSPGGGDFGGGGNKGGGNGKGRDLDFQQRGMSKKDYDATKETEVKILVENKTSLKKLLIFIKNFLH